MVKKQHACRRPSSKQPVIYGQFLAAARNAASRLLEPAPTPRALLLPQAPGSRSQTPLIPSISTTYPSAPIPYINHFSSQKERVVIKILSTVPREPGARQTRPARAQAFVTFTSDNQKLPPILIKTCIIGYKLFHCCAEINLGAQLRYKGGAPARTVAITGTAL